MFWKVGRNLKTQRKLLWTQGEHTRHIQWLRLRMEKLCGLLAGYIITQQPKALLLIGFKSFAVKISSPCAINLRLTGGWLWTCQSSCLKVFWNKQRRQFLMPLKSLLFTNQSVITHTVMETTSSVTSPLNQEFPKQCHDRFGNVSEFSLVNSKHVVWKSCLRFSSICFYWTLKGGEGGGRNVRILEECVNMEGFDVWLRWERKQKTQYGVMETNGNTLTTSLFIFK